MTLKVIHHVYEWLAARVILYSSFILSSKRAPLTAGQHLTKESKHRMLLTLYKRVQLKSMQMMCLRHWWKKPSHKAKDSKKVMWRTQDLDSPMYKTLQVILCPIGICYHISKQQLLIVSRPEKIYLDTKLAHSTFCTHTFKYRGWCLELLPNMLRWSEIHVHRLCSKICSSGSNLMRFEL